MYRTTHLSYDDILILFESVISVIKEEKLVYSTIHNNCAIYLVH